MTAPTPSDVVSFWQGAGRERWFAKDDAFDREVALRLGSLQADAAEGRLEAWAHDPLGSLALVLLLDQVPRNLFRGTARAFATDGTARAIATRALAAGWDRQVPGALRPFFFLPFMHSEDLGDQDRCVALYQAAGDEDGLKWAREHRDIIARFGRFPHRNAALGRAMTPEEAEFLAGGGFTG